MSVEVVSCFEVRARRRRNEEGGSDCKDPKASRLCIFDDDRTRLLNYDVWPSSVIISDWVSKQRPQAEGAGRTCRDSVTDANGTIGHRCTEYSSRRAR